ncbi:MAG: MBL fold metallo-hydrolase [Pseudomonadales bacterium]
MRYPSGLRWSPPFGEPHEVADGVFWLRMPLPMQLDHINLWLLRDGDGWVIVDTGMYDPGCQQTWEKLFASFLSPAQVRRIVVTHFHPDHLGLASWLQEKCGCDVFISEPEYAFYYYLRTRDFDNYAGRAEQIQHELGIDAATSKISIKAFGEVNKSKTLDAAHCQFLADGAELEIGGRRWRAVSGSGHSPLHLCWYAEASGLLLSGDQALPRISSNVSVFVDSIDQNPLQAWLASCAKLRRQIAADTLVLPAHQEPFVGIGERMQQLIDGHERDLDTLRAALVEPLSTEQASHALFPRKLDTFGRLMAVGETLAHINYLLASSEIKSRLDADGIRRYSRGSD